MYTQSYKIFSKRLDNLANKKRFPLTAMFELTYRCNFKCIHCYNTDEQRNSKLENELKTKEVFNILDQLRDLGCLYLSFTGGEIFLRKDILDIIEFARKLGFELALLTNGSLIDEHTANRLKELMLNKAEITVHAINKEIFDKITQTRGSADKVFKAIDLLHKRNITLGIKSCGMQENKSEIINISNFARSLNSLYRFNGRIMPRQDRSKDPLKYSISPEEVHYIGRLCYPEMFLKYDEKGRVRKKIKIRGRNLKKLFNCGAGEIHLTINPYGELNICLEIDYPRYKILDGSLKEGWQKIKDFVENLIPLKDWVCRTCNLVKYCYWCPGKSYLTYGNFSTCDQVTRIIAEVNKKMYQK